MPTITKTKLSEDLVNQLLREGPALQFITALKVSPGANAVRFSFQTKFRSLPVIEIFNFSSGDHSKDINAANLVTNNIDQTIGAPRKKSHNYRMPQPAEWVPAEFPGIENVLLGPLKQDTHFWFRITADTPYKGVNAAIVMGHFWTGKRDVSVVIEDLLVSRYGSSAAGNAIDDGVNTVAGFFGQSPPIQEYSLDLFLAIYDQLQGLTGQLKKDFKSSNNNGDVRNPFPYKSLDVTGASDFIWLYSFGRGDRDSLSFGNFAGFDVPVVPPANAGHGEADDGPWAEAVTVSARLPDDETELLNYQVSGALPMPMILSSGNWGTSYDVTTWLSATITPPRHAPVIFASPIDKLRDGLFAHEKVKAHAYKMKASDEGALLVAGKDQLHLFVPGAQDTLWLKTRLAGSSPKTNTPWLKIADDFKLPLVISANGDENMHLVSSDSEGQVKFAKYHATENGGKPLQWQKLSHPISEEIAIVEKANGCYVFIANENGSVGYTKISDKSKAGPWRLLGGEIETELKAVHLNSEKIALFGLDKSGQVWTYTVEDTEETKTDWNSLGGSDLAQLIAVNGEKDSLILLAIDKKRMVYRKTLHNKTWAPSGKNWTELGLLDALFGPQK